MKSVTIPPFCAPLTTTSHAPSAITMKSSELLNGESSLQIEHQGAIYVLRITAKGGLILTK
jgi:hemin uptake protein HemP